MIKERTSLIASAGGKTLMVDASTLGLLNCINELDLADTLGTVAAIDIGSTYSHVVIYGRDGLPFVRDLTIAGQSIVESICSDLDMSEDQIRMALNGKDVDADIQNQVLLAMNNAVRPLATAINETLRYYSLQEKGAGVEKIYLCGGFSLIDAFVEFLTDALPVEVEILNPFEKMTCQSGVEDDQSLTICGPAWATAVGLAMRTI